MHQWRINLSPLLRATRFTDTILRPRVPAPQSRVLLTMGQLWAGRFDRHTPNLSLGCSISMKHWIYALVGQRETRHLAWMALGSAKAQLAMCTTCEPRIVL